MCNEFTFLIKPKAPDLFVSSLGELDIINSICCKSWNKARHENFYSMSKICMSDLFRFWWNQNGICMTMEKPSVKWSPEYLTELRKRCFHYIRRASQMRFYDIQFPRMKKTLYNLWYNLWLKSDDGSASAMWSHSLISSTNYATNSLPFIHAPSSNLQPHENSVGKLAKCSETPPSK